MVQEITTMESPSPQTVGLHFVQQYYTMLNKAPQYLHRFYSNNSQFLRGGHDPAGKAETSVKGQQEIHNKIMELNFRDCHTKIIMVDSQETLHEGVVIQVSGELSNDGQPLRRFMQTFVLALQSPKQYYVLNDILRYQDDVFPEDEENDLQSGDIEVEDVHAEVGDTTGNIQDASLSHYYGQHVLNNGTVHAHLEKTPVMVPASLPTAPMPATIPLASLVVHPVVAAVHPAVVPAPVTVPAPKALPVVSAATVQVPTPVATVVQQKQQPAFDEPEPIVNNSNSNNNASAVVVAAAATNTINNNNNTVVENEDYVSSIKEQYNMEKAPSKSPELQGSGEPSANEPRTYATMVSRNSVQPGTSPNSSNPSATTAVKGLTGMPNSQPPMRSDVRSNDNYSNSYVPPQPQRPPQSRSMRGVGSSNYSGPPRERTSNSRLSSEEPVEYERARSISSTVPDSQQVFVGNIPLDMNNDELRSVFSKHGKVLEVRIQQKYGPPKSTSVGRQPLSYGFIVFDSPAAVQNVLGDRSNQTVYIRNSHRLNVEEKRTNRARPMYGGGGSGGGGGGGGSGGNEPRMGMPRVGGPGGGNSSGRGGGPPISGGRGGGGGSGNRGGAPMSGGMNRGNNGYGGGGGGRGYSFQGPNRDRRQ